MSRVRATFVAMAALSAGTLVLGMLRELVIARHLQASAAADLFFRGVVVVSAARSFALALLRARWIPLPPGPAPRALLRNGLRGCTVTALVSVAALALVIPAGQWTSAQSLTFAACVIVASYGAAIRALAERNGHERRSLALDWLPLLTTIAGTSWAALEGGSVPLGATGGLTIGMLFATAALWPSAMHGAGDDPVTTTASPPWSLYVDTLVYVNLGLVDSLLSIVVLGDGDLALLSYAYMFVNAILAVPTAGATILALRAGAGAANGAIRRWAVLAGVVAGTGVAIVALLLGHTAIGSLVDGAVGWSVAGRIELLVLASVPFAALRMANTVGRQVRIARDPDGVVPWDIGGLVLRVAMLGIGAAWLGPLASPLALALAEAIQLAAWWRTAAPQRA